MTQLKNPELADVSSLINIEEVAARLLLLEQAQQECRENIVNLVNEEMADKAISHAPAIHELKQRRTVIEFQIVYLRSRLNRLREEKEL